MFDLKQTPHHKAGTLCILVHVCWCVAQADVARAIKEECEGELAVAMPILEDALAALDTIKEADITYIRKLGNPPGAIKLVMEVCHCRLAHALCLPVSLFCAFEFIICVC